MTMHNAIR